MIDNLLNLLNQLEEGTYKKDNIIIKQVYTKAGYNAEVYVDDIIYTISYTYGGGYTINKKLDDKSSLHISTHSVGKQFKFITTRINDTNYNIYDYGISKNDEEIYFLNDNEELIKRTDDNTVISVRLRGNAGYVYYRKFNTPLASKDLENDYIKNNYNAYLARDINEYNEKIKETKKQLKDSLKLNSLKELIDTINLNKINDNVYEEIKKLDEIVKIFNKYRNKFDLINKKEYDEIESFINYLISEPDMCKINKITNILDSIDFSDINSVVKLRDDLNALIESKQNTKKKTK